MLFDYTLVDHDRSTRDVWRIVKLQTGIEVDLIFFDIFILRKRPIFISIPGLLVLSIQEDQEADRKHRDQDEVS